jgi:hypothetical protein
MLISGSKSGRLQKKQQNFSMKSIYYERIPQNLKGWWGTKRKMEIKKAGP